MRNLSYAFRGLLLGLLGCLALAGGANVAWADQGDPLVYYGGPVVHAATGVIVSWGAQVNPLFTDPVSGDPGLIKSLAAASGTPGGVEGVLAQYMDVSGQNAANRVSYGGAFTIHPSVIGTPLADAQVQSELAAQIESGSLPRPSGNGLSTVYLLLFPAGQQICMPDGQGGSACSGVDFCAYHGSTSLRSGAHVLYAVLPDNTSGGMAHGCGPASASDPRTLPNQTSFLSHEWSEAITDPLGDEASAAAAPLGWYDTACAAGSTTATCVNGEIGDKCAGQQGTNGAWTVQLEWSNLDRACVAAEAAYAAPTAAFTPPASPVAGGPAGFDASASNDPAGNSAAAAYDGRSLAIRPGLRSYTWNWGDGSTGASGASAQHTFARSGTYAVALTVTDALGFSSTVTRSVTVAAPSASAAARTVPPAPASPTGATSPTGPASSAGRASSTSGRTAGAPPLAATGAAARAGAHRVRLTGTVTLRGEPVAYHFEFGTTPALGQSSAPVRLAGEGVRPVSAVLGGLRPRTLYRYRLVLATPRGTALGALRTFRTAPARGSRSPRLSLRIASATVVRAGANRVLRLRVRVSCPSACDAQLALAPVLSGRARLAAVPLTLLRARVALGRGGARSVLLTLRGSSRPERRVLRLSGYATGSGEAATPTVSELVPRR